MNLPQPTDAFTNPIQYWSDVIVMQIEISRQVYDAARLVNPFLPDLDFEPSGVVGPAPVRKSPRRAKRKPAARKAVTPVTTLVPAKKVSPPAPSVKGEIKPVAKAKTVEAKPATQAAAKSVPALARKTATKSKPAPKTVAASAKPKTDSKPAVKAAAPRKPKSAPARATTRKAKVTLAPDLPPSTTVD